MNAESLEIRKKKIDQHHCQDCKSICCTDFAMMIPRPRTKSDIEEVKWYLHYDTVSVCIRNQRWYLTVKGRCIYLDEHHMCTIYDRRPDKCRNHKPPECERYGAWYHVIFHTPEDLVAFLEKEKRRKKKRARRLLRGVRVATLNSRRKAPGSHQGKSKRKK